MVQVRGSPATPVVPYLANSGSTGAVAVDPGASYTLIVAANPDRAGGVYLQGTDLVGAVTVANRYVYIYPGTAAPADDTSSFKMSSSYTSESSEVGNEDFIFIRGGAAIYARSTTGVAGKVVAYQEV